MLIDYIIENFGINEPIFINEVHIEGMSDNALRQAFNRLLKNEDIQRFDTGIYYMPGSSGILNKSYLDSNKVVKKKYITDGSKIYGYTTGFSFANQIGLTSQNPVIKEIVSNKESSKGRMVTLGTKKVYVKRSKAIITNDNYKELQLLDLIGNFEKWTEYEETEVKERLINYIKEEKLNRNIVRQYLYCYSGIVVRRLIEMELIYEFAS